MSLLALTIAGLGEFRIRDLNYEINKLLREKGHWEIRIKELGGPDYRVIIHKSGNSTDTKAVSHSLCVSQRFGPRMLDHEGKEVPGNRGYKYFGAARDLPGVRELFEKERTCHVFTSCFPSNQHAVLLSERLSMFM